MSRQYKFSKLNDWNPGQGPGRYVSNHLKKYAQDMLKSVFQDLPEDFEVDPWGLGNPDINDV